MSRRDLTDGPVWKALAHVSAPMSFGILAVMSVGLADAYFLGQLGETPLAAIGFIFPVTAAFASLAIGLSAGANALVSQSLGRGDDKSTTARYALHAFGLGILLASLIALLVWMMHGWLFTAMGASTTVLNEISLYIPFWSLSFPLLAAMMIVNAVFRAHGSGSLSAMIMVLAAVINIILDPLLIFGWGPVPSLGTEGAAIASAIGRGTAAIVAIGYAVHAGYLDFRAGIRKDLRQSLSQLISISAPAAFSNAINPAGMALVTAAVATLGDAAVAGFGAATRVQSLAVVAMLALSAGIGPVVGQNWGADQKPRARKALKLSWLFCFVYGAAIGLVLALLADPIADTIASDANAASYTASYLRIVGWSLFGYGVVIVTNAAMNARSKAVHSMSLSLGRIFVLYLPLAWAGVTAFGYVGILVAAIVANVVSAIAAVIVAQSVGLSASNNSLVTRTARRIPS